MNSVTELLSAMGRGETRAAADLLPLVYEELRRLAASRLAQEAPGQTLQATALVHEAYLRLVGDAATPLEWEGRRHFFGAAALAMRRILVESARRRQRLKHGGDRERAEFDDALALAPEIQEDVVSLDEALLKLNQIDPIGAELVNLRYFAGLTMPEVAVALNLSPRTAERTWSFARAWLYRELQNASDH